MMKKFGITGKPKVVSPEEHVRIENELHKMGKTSAKELTPEQRPSLDPK